MYVDHAVFIMYFTMFTNVGSVERESPNLSLLAFCPFLSEDTIFMYLQLQVKNESTCVHFNREVFLLLLYYTVRSSIFTQKGIFYQRIK
jgi:hypothetical protein